MDTTVPVPLVFNDGIRCHLKYRGLHSWSSHLRVWFIVAGSTRRRDDVTRLFVFGLSRLDLSRFVSAYFLSQNTIYFTSPTLFMRSAEQAPNNEGEILTPFTSSIYSSFSEIRCKSNFGDLCLGTEQKA